MGVTMNIPLGGAPHGASLHDNTVFPAAGMTEWDGMTINTEFIATGAGIAIHMGSMGSTGNIKITIDKDDAGTDIKEYVSAIHYGETTITVPFDAGDGVTFVVNALTSLTRRVYYFA